ncbi:hypothetical protein OXPF_36750 [Oxobacter pfennigii]|uniref:DUF951 domain-containing protein n=1 Tax=Oxobacter pfennigii TaxID=36849 RepID=A0A0P8WKN9_9CLOT|nr:DUF951 domain-containing protein [Oxobacter pfennigii]KPU42906.1 hypothetical protein OXPF_36750 [Oxobacter pfennigii]
MPGKFYVGDIVQMRKQHPCGSFEWEVLRIGADFRIKCVSCGRQVMLPRPKFEKGVKKVIKSNAPMEENSQQM